VIVPSKNVRPLVHRTKVLRRALVSARTDALCGLPMPGTTAGTTDTATKRSTPTVPGIHKATTDGQLLEVLID
jgi:hypothetical protein